YVHVHHSFTYSDSILSEKMSSELTVDAASKTWDILCVLAGDDDEPFDIPCTNDTTIAQLKQAIYQECTDKLSHLRPRSLKLYLVPLRRAVDDTVIEDTVNISESCH